MAEQPQMPGNIPGFQNILGAEGLNPPPKPTTPLSAPWDDIREITSTLKMLTQSMAQYQGLAGPTVLMTGGGGGSQIILPASFGAPGSVTQMINVMLEGTPGALGPGQNLPFYKDVAKETSETQERLVLINGVVDTIIMGFPAGCQQLVDVRVLYFPPSGGGVYNITPSIDDTYVKFEDFTATFHPNYPVRKPGKIRVEWINYDTGNSHEVPVYVNITPSRLVT